MSIHIIIDGYNLIRQSDKLVELDRQDIQRGREALIDMLAAYKKIKAHRITVVFDGTAAPRMSAQRDRQKGISIVFSHRGESADAVIKKMSCREGQKALVVSSDQEVVRAASSWGAATIGAGEFEDKLALAGGIESAENENTLDGWKPTTQKKGPRRRLPKKKRRNRARIRKL
jgi:predicted RNA-binding protein with PIN domain